MTRARKELISLESTPYYHCISRCVRRAFLCGEDSLTGKNFEHRKTWVTERLRELASVFAIDICAYAVMSNHYHLVLRVDRERVDGWDDSQVIEHWSKLFKSPLLIARYLKGERQTEAELLVVEETLVSWRDRLKDVSWFMRCLNEYLARRANEEDRCKGRFWEGRFKSQALLDDAAVLTCMSYVDLNPIRAGLADTPEASDFTSIQQRIREYSEKEKPIRENLSSVDPVPLMPLVAQSKDRHPNAIGFVTVDYLELIDWVGRAVREGKRGTIPSDIPPILDRLGLEPTRYLDHMSGRARMENSAVIGRQERVRRLADHLGRSFIKGIGEARRLYRLRDAVTSS